MGHTHLLSSRQETSSRHRSVMKILVVLTLAVFTGCNAAVLLQDQPKPQLDIVPKPQLDIVTDAFWDYVAKATHTAQDILQNIKQSELGQGVNAMISESTDAVNQYTVALCGQGLLAKITHEVAMLKARLDQDLRKGVTPFIEALNPEALKAALLQKSEELKRSLEKSVKELQVPHSEELRQQMELSESGGFPNQHDSPDSELPDSAGPDQPGASAEPGLLRRGDEETGAQRPGPEGPADRPLGVLHQEDPVNGQPVPGLMAM